MMGFPNFCGITGCRNYGGMMGPGFGLMGNGYAWGFSGRLGLAGVLSGLAVIIGSLMLHNNPTQHSTWGLVILIFSALSILGSSMGGFGIGLVFGVIGGVHALTWKQSKD